MQTLLSLLRIDTASTGPATTAGLYLWQKWGRPDSRSPTEWGKLASRAKKRWLQGDKQSCIDYCYMTSVIRFLKRPSKPLAWAVEQMKYPEGLVCHT